MIEEVKYQGRRRDDVVLIYRQKKYTEGLDLHQQLS